MIEHPYDSWSDKQSLDYRGRQTQNESYVRDMLNSDAFLLDDKRVNLGKNYPTRSQNDPTQEPMNYQSPDMWGWENWMKNKPQVPSTKATNLYVPRSQGSTSWSGCSSCKRPRKLI
jgi:hypothetical protein